MSTILPNPIWSGDSFPIALTFWSVPPTDPTNPSTGTVRNLTGYKVGCTVKANAGDTDSQAKFQQDIAGDTTGKIAFAVTALPVGSYWIDIKIWDASNVRSTVVNPTQFNVQQSITQREIPA